MVICQWVLEKVMEILILMKQILGNLCFRILVVLLCTLKNLEIELFSHLYVCVYAYGCGYVYVDMYIYVCNSCQLN